MVEDENLNRMTSGKFHFQSASIARELEEYSVLGLWVRGRVSMINNLQ